MAALKMDIDESLLRDWEDDSILMFDDDDDFTSLLSQCTDNSKSQPSNSHPKDESFLKGLDEDLDYAFALSLQTQYEEDLKDNSDIFIENTASNTPQSSKPLSIVDQQWELIDPHPDIHALFLEYDAKFFYGKLLGVEVRWSPRMTLCAGVCCYEGMGGLCSVRLSVPLLKLRPRRDLVETLLHEMIHAYLFVTHNNKDREGHGPEFISHMNRINKETGTRISVYHSFHNEVDLYRQHWWKCDGPCRDRRPFYGLVKRAMNRVPGPKDTWWAAHQASCSGKFVKIKEPENYKKKAPKRKATSDFKGSDLQQSNITGFFKDQTPKPGPKGNIFNKPLTKSSVTTITSVLSKEDNIVPVHAKGTSAKEMFVPFQGGGQKLGGSVKNPPILHMPIFSMHSNSSNSQKKLHSSAVNSTQSAPLFKSLKVQKIGSSGNSKITDTKLSSSKVPTTPSKKFVQSPIEKFLSPSKVHPKVEIHKNQSSVNVPNVRDTVDVEILTVACPVCCTRVKNSEINSHLDRCIQT